MSAADPQQFESQRALNQLAGVFCFLFCLLVHHVCSDPVSRRCSATYRELSWQLRMEWDSRIISTIHAAVVTCLSLYSLLLEQPSWNDKITGTTQIAGVTLAASAAYMVADSVSMPIYWRDVNLLIFWLHHGIAASCFIICSQQGVLQFFALFRLVSEMSTPFLNVTWFCRITRMDKSSLTCLLNSLCLTTSYIWCRILVIPVYWLYFMQAAAGRGGIAALAQQLGFHFWLWCIGSVLLDLLNVYWARKILTGGVRTARIGLTAMFADKEEKFGHLS